MSPTTDTPRTTEQWYVVHCKPLKEWEAAAALETHLGLTVYLPALKRRLHGKVQQTPFFPCYLFISGDLQAVPVSSINATPGVLRLLSFGDLLQPIPSSVIEAIRQRIDSLNAHGGWAQHGFHAGDVVQLRDGPFQGLEAVFVGSKKASERVQVLIEFLGRLSKVEVAVKSLEPSNMCSIPKRERRTRGKGRWIHNQ